MTPEQGQRRVEIADADGLRLELRGLFYRDHLGVFIQDPQNRELYWYRRLGLIKSRAVEENRQQRSISYRLYVMGGFDTNPCPEEALPMVLEQVIAQEDAIDNNTDSAIRERSATVGIARYEGNRLFTLEQITDLVAFEYLRLRASISN